MEIEGGRFFAFLKESLAKNFNAPRPVANQENSQ
jgi:hypothetical protein